MATDTLKTGMPIYDLDVGMSIVFDAIDPTTGATVAGVVVSNAAIYGDGTTTVAGDTTSGIQLSSAWLPG